MRDAVDLDELGAIAWCDGSGNTADRPAGFGVVILDGITRTEVSMGIGHGTNNRGELAGLRSALLRTRAARRVRIYSDSEYALGMALHDRYKVRANHALVAELRALVRERADAVTLAHIEGHCAVPGNELADLLASQGRLHQHRSVITYRCTRLEFRLPRPVATAELRALLAARMNDPVLSEGEVQAA